MKIWKNIKPEFVDERGYIMKVLDDGTTNIKSILRITSKKGAIRANHYHKTDAHFCYLVSGKMEYTEAPVDDHSKKEVEVLDVGDMVWTPPMMAHAMKFLEDSEFWAFSTKSRHQEAYEEDTVRIQLI